MNRINAILWATALAASALPSCGGRSPGDIPPDRAMPAAGAPTTGLALPVRVVTARGGVDARTTGEEWIALAEPTTGVTAVRARGRGAVLALGEAGADRGTLWLRGGAEVHMAQGDDGALYVDVARGQVRMSLIDPELVGYVRTADRLIDVTARDVVARRDGGDADLALAYTAQQPDLAGWSLAIETERTEAEGIGALEARRPDGGEALLELRRLDVAMRTEGDYALTEVTHTFHNPTDARMEGTFRFPLPHGAMLLGLAMEIDGRMMEGEIVEKVKARRIYEEIVDQMQDPALLEWEHGTWFKLRVFPIEPVADKRVVIRYATPLVPTVGGFEYVYATAAPDMQVTIPAFVLTADGTEIVAADSFVAGDDIVVPIASADVPEVTRETRADGVYTAVRIDPDWDAWFGDAPRTTRMPDRHVIVLFDTSRSALEGRELALDSLRLLLAELSPSDKVAVAAVDIATTIGPDGFSAATPEIAERAVAFVEGIEPDGASNLEAAFERVAELRAAAVADGAAHVQVIYIGDGTATWGETDTAALRTLAEKALDGAGALHAEIIGKGASADAWRELTGHLSGRVEIPRTALDARRAAFFLARAPTVDRIDRVTLSAGDDTALFPAAETTIYRGDAITAVMRTPPDEGVPAALTLRGVRGDEVVERTFPLVEPTPAKIVAQRWATQHMAALDAAGADKQTIVATSVDFGVLSRHTSLLVLESEEAYEQHQIERRQEELAAADPTVTGGDLDSLGGRSASLSPDYIQPGDPEIRVPAPPDARSVVVVFPFGETKIAEFDPDADAWIVRFLIDKDTPDGEYHVIVRITGADGEVRSLRLPYFVDTAAPAVDVEVERTRAGYRITARQRVTEVDMGDGKTARVIYDATRVEITTPDGEVIALGKKADGVFRGTWKVGALAADAAVRVTVTDEALNQSSFDLTIAAEAR